MLQTTLCYLEKDGKYLMLHRTAKDKDVNKDKWIGVGGKFEPGETPEECLVRELREELGFEARVEGIVDARAEYEAGDFLILYYNVAVVSGEPSPLEHAQIKYVPPCELAEYDFPGTDAAVAEKLAAAD